MEPTFHSNGDFYKYVDQTIVEMRNAGLNEEADRLYTLRHKGFWNFRDELFLELGQAIQSILDSTILPATAHSMLEHCIATMRINWPELARDPREIYPARTRWPADKKGSP
jgi:hypothetical protein